MPASQKQLSLTTAVESLTNTGPTRAAALRRLGLRCVADLLLHLPLRYQREHAEQTIKAAQEAVIYESAGGEIITVQGTIATMRVSRGRRWRIEATLEDPTGTLMLIWFNAPWMRNKLHPDMKVRAWGPAKLHNDYVQLVNPRIEDLTNQQETEQPREDRMRPVYPASEEITSAAIESIIDSILNEALASLEDHLPEDYRKSKSMPTLAEAYRMMHRPADDEEVDSGRRRLAFDELLLLQLAVMLKRRHRREALSAIPLRHSDAIRNHILARLPFTLTPHQQEVVQEIATDVQDSVPMNRLLQGDVGSGKTVVALYAMLMAVAAKHQAAMMAPTELLAEQHHASISEMLAGSNVIIELLTGSLTAAQRSALRKRLESGEIDLLIGTHALLTESVAFKSLAIVIIDEQHRFGVHQRAGLRSKAGDAEIIPHTLVMTATPIPRTLSLTVFGDLDISTIRGMPPGRSPIINRHVSSAKTDEVYNYVAGQLRAGHQAYIVVPAIEDSSGDLRNVTMLLDSLRKGPMRDLTLAALHGRLNRDQREQVMQDFRAGTIHAIVATTVIEVGVDVPNATIMVIEQADRFGLAQLHQLRGRVGRGTEQGLCIFIADPTTDDGQARIDAIKSTNDGFAIAEKDLEIRGPGELFGARQSGVAPFRVATFPRDVALLNMARRDAVKWIDENPQLKGERDALLRRRLLKAHGKALGLGDVA